MKNNVHELKHPLVEHHLTSLRDQSTPSEFFRNQVRRLTSLLTYEATSSLPLCERTIRTPLEETTGHVLKQRIGLVPILRAGLGMVEPVLDLIPEAEVWHLGFYRDEATLKPVEYYQKLPEQSPVDLALILDPMLATGGSANAAVQAIQSWGVPHISLLALIAAPEGIHAVQQATPDIEIYVGSIDQHLNDRAYIVPGLGDAGDRIFNTELDG